MVTNLFYSFSQFKLDKISFPKSAIFYFPKVNALKKIFHCSIWWKTMVEAVERKSRTHKKLPTSFTIFLWFHLVSCAIWSSKFVCLSMFGCRFVWWGSNISIGNQKDNNVSNGLPSGNKSTPFQNIFLLSLHTCQSEEKCACLLH